MFFLFVSISYYTKNDEATYAENSETKTSYNGITPTMGRDTVQYTVH